jgi:UDP-N-acetylmuramyl tripeptide synthase
VSDLKIVANNPDAALTATAQGLKIPVVYVLNMQENIECLRRQEGGNSSSKLKTIARRGTNEQPFVLSWLASLTALP